MNEVHPPFTQASFEATANSQAICKILPLCLTKADAGETIVTPVSAESVPIFVAAMSVKSITPLGLVELQV
jgi:hypothetical protein